MKFLFCLFVFFLMEAFPKEVRVIEGEVEFIESEGALSVIQRSPTATIEWEAFSIDAGETIEFVLPSEEASIVNRIVDCSQIEGMLKSNGCICLDQLRGSLKNSGRIEAARVELRAAGGEPFAILQSGIIQAKGEEGRVFLSTEGSIEISGVITAADVESRKGGQIEICAESIFLRKGSELDASGDWGGGKILVESAARVLTEEGASLRTDARMDGDGGRILVFAKLENLFLGLASVQGGCMGGDGGFVEITSLGSMRYLGRVSLLAPFGKLGTCAVSSLD